MTTLDDLLYAVARAPEITALMRRGGGIQPSDLVRRVGRPLAREELVRAGVAGAGYREPLAPAQLADARVVAGGLEGRVLQAAHVANAILDDVEASARTEGLSFRRTEIGEATLTRVTGRMLAGGDPADVEWRSAVVESLLSRVREPQRLTPGEYAKRFASTWDEEWAAGGAQALAAFPPSGIALGADRRPPLIRPEARSTCSWLDGLGRSVYDRYAQEWRGRLAAADPHQGWPGHRAPRPRGESRDGAREEVTRAARPYGLEHPEHRDVLRAAFLGAGGEATPGAWRRMAGACRAAGSVGELAAGISDYLALARRGAALRTLELRFGDLGTYPDLVARAIVRKLWMDVHRQEQRFTEPMCTCLVSRQVRVAVDKSVAEGLAAWLGVGEPGGDGDGWGEVDDPAGGAGGRAAGASDTSPQAADDWQERANATFTLLLERPEVLQDVLRGGPDRLARYRSSVAEDAAGHLSVDELLAYLRTQGAGEDGPR
jgi:hypothetical protein